MLLVLLITLAFHGVTRNQDFRRYHESLAEEAASSLASRVSRFVRERQRLVGVFVRQHADALEALLDQPGDERRYLRVESLIADYFPDYFAFMLSDAGGRPRLEDIEGMVGDLCRQDLRHFASRGDYRPRVHPHPEGYHFDVMARMETGDGVLFVSFRTDILAVVIRQALLPAHDLMLVYPEDNDLIEITREGSRLRQQRQDYHLSAGERARVLARKPVAGTHWQAVDLIRPGVFRTFVQEKILAHSLAILLLFALVSLILLRIMRDQERLRRASQRQKDEFLSIVSHELRTPLTSIRGTLSLLAHGVIDSSDEKGRHMIRMALDNSERLASLIDDLLDLRRIEAGKMEYTMERQRIDQFIETCVESHQGLASEYGVTFQVQHPLPDLCVEMDVKRMTQVLGNLLSNAAKYGAEKDNVIVSARETGGYVRISVQDHGRGISPEDGKRLFGKFVQLDASDRRARGGSGLGLSIVKAIVEAHHGRVGFESSPGMGATFYVDLPVVGVA